MVNPAYRCGVCMVRDAVAELGSERGIQARYSSRLTGVRATASGYEVDVLTTPNVIDAEACIECGACLEACPKQAIARGPGWKYYVTDACDGCGKCIEACPVDAIRMDRTAAAETHEVAGTLFGSDDARICLLDGMRVNAVPKGWMVVCHNEDKPLVLGRVCSVIGEAGVNIANLYLGRDELGGEASMIVNVDEALSDEVLKKIEEVPHVHQARLVQLLVERIDVDEGGLDIRLRSDGLSGLVQEFGLQAEIAAWVGL